jgi:hypothetical protein
MTQHPEYVSPDSAMDFLSDDGGIEHNLCTCTTLFFRRSSQMADDDSLQQL